MTKVMTIVGTRPELIKISRVMAELDQCVNHVLVHTGQNYDYEPNQIFFDDLEIRKPDYFLDAAGSTPSKTIAEVISRADEVLEKERPDAVLFYGDTNSCLAVIAAKRHRVPEELNRKVLDHLSDINLVLTEHARRYLLAEGVRPETIMKTGSHMQEVLNYYMPKISASAVLEQEKLEAGKFIVVSAHREENVDSQQNLSDFLDSLEALADTYQFPVIVSTHPRTRKRLDELGTANDHPLIRFTKPFGLLDYIKLQMSAFCIVSDSGTITEEASLLNLPAITVRNAHERPEGMDEGTLIMSGLKRERVLEAVKVVATQHSRDERVFPLIPDYDAGPVSKQVLRIVLSYIDYVNRTVWHKSVD
jgi:UDP-N-acetylglucosamine 2-epimerase (non-hydrolysing)